MVLGFEIFFLCLLGGAAIAIGTWAAIVLIRLFRGQR